MTMWTPELQREDRAKYRALADAIEADVFAGRLAPGDRLPTHRDLADALGVNVGTVTRGYAEAERRGLVSATVGRGTFIATDARSPSGMVSFEPSAPGMIEMGLVEPIHALDPSPRDGLRHLLRRRDTDLFTRYADPRGLRAHREAGTAWAARFGIRATAEDIVVCAGAQHGLTYCLAGLLGPGSRLAADRLTYPGLKALAAMLGIKLAPVDLDEDGMLPEALDAACRRTEVRAVYLMPGMQNPTTAHMPEARREALADVARSHGLVIIEDDAYGLTRPGPGASLSALAPERTVAIAGTSKTLAAGLRIGFIACGPWGMDRLARAVLNTVWMAPPLGAELVCRWILDGTADAVLERKLAEARLRMALAREFLAPHVLHGADTGFYAWLELPGELTGSEFEALARAVGVNVFGADRFVVGDASEPRAVRLSLSGPADLDETRRGLGIVRGILDETRDGGTKDAAG